VVDTGDTAVEEEEEEEEDTGGTSKGDCGCDAGTGGAGVLALLLGLFGIRRRR
jgi:MYXO-CTERM domain-containing protein